MNTQLRQSLTRLKFEIANGVIAFRRCRVIRRGHEPRDQDRRKECEDSDYSSHVRPHLALLKSLDVGRRWKIEWAEFVNVVGQTEQERLFALRGERTARSF